MKIMIFVSKGVRLCCAFDQYRLCTILTDAVNLSRSVVHAPNLPAQTPAWPRCRPPLILPGGVGPTGDPPSACLVQVHVDLHPAYALDDGAECLRLGFFRGPGVSPAAFSAFSSASASIFTVTTAMGIRMTVDVAHDGGSWNGTRSR